MGEQIQQMLVAANGQEGPEAFEEPKLQVLPAKPLSKEQQAEAAKLAERRKLFDNKRYQNERPPANENNQAGPPPGFSRTNMNTMMKMNSNINTNTDTRPATDMMLGLSFTQNRGSYQ